MMHCLGLIVTIEMKWSCHQISIYAEFLGFLCSTRDRLKGIRQRLCVDAAWRSAGWELLAQMEFHAIPAQFGTCQFGWYVGPRISYGSHFLMNALCMLGICRASLRSKFNWCRWRAWFHSG